jgi:hypothetical protein
MNKHQESFVGAGQIKIRHKTATDS